MESVALKPLEVVKDARLLIKQDFYKTKNEYIVDSGALTLISGVIHNATNSVVYTVPAGYNLYIVSGYLSYELEANITSTGDTSLNIDELGVLFQFRIKQLTTPNKDSLTNSYPIPIKIRAGQAIKLYIDQDDISVLYQLTAYLMPINLDFY
jgi:hypothetical protein